MMNKTNITEGKSMVSKAQIQAVSVYNKKNYDEVKIRAPKGYRDSVIRIAAEADGVSINEYVMSAVAEKTMRDHPEIGGASAWKISKI